MLHVGGQFTRIEWDRVSILPKQVVSIYKFASALHFACVFARVRVCVHVSDALHASGVLLCTHAQHHQHRPGSCVVLVVAKSGVDSSNGGGAVTSAAASFLCPLFCLRLGGRLIVWSCWNALFAVALSCFACLFKPATMKTTHLCCSVSDSPLIA